MPNPEKLRKTLNEFLEDLKTVFTERSEISDLELIEGLLIILPDAQLVSSIYDALIPYKKQITSKDDKYFISNCSKIFNGLPTERVNHFVSVLQNSKRVDAETRGVIFDYLIVMIKMAE